MDDDLRRPQFFLRIFMDSAILVENPTYELARILRKAANEITTGTVSQPNILDQNGNMVGYYNIVQ